MKYKKPYLIFLLSFFVFSSFSTGYLQAVEIDRQPVASFIEKIEELSVYQLVGATLFVGFFSFIGYKFSDWFFKKSVSQPEEKPAGKKIKEKGKGKPNFAGPITPNEKKDKETQKTGNELVVKAKQSVKRQEPERIENENEKRVTEEPKLKKKKSVSWDPSLTKTISITNSVPSLCNFMNYLITIIDNKMKLINDNHNPQVKDSFGQNSFILMEGLKQNEEEQELQKYQKTISNEIAITTDQERLADISSTLKKYSAMLEGQKENLARVMLRIADTDEELYRNIDESLEDLIKVGVPKTDAYKILNFNKNPVEISVQEIKKRYIALSQEHGGVQTTYGKKVRQAGYVLASEQGKLLYDAYLNGSNFLSIYRINPVDAENNGLDFMSLSTRILTAKNYLDSLRNEVNKRIEN